MTDVIVLNGGSSSGKSGIARCLQAVLPDPWLALGTDTLVDAMPASLQASDAGIEFAPDGEVVVEFMVPGRVGKVVDHAGRLPSSQLEQFSMPLIGGAVRQDRP
jgi:chloramphenicol 3-O-phosphotransferase